MPRVVGGILQPGPICISARIGCSAEQSFEARRAGGRVSGHDAARRIQLLAACDGPTRIDTNLSLVRLHGGLDGLEIRTTGRLGAAAGEVLHGEDDNPRQDAKDHDDDEEFDEGEAALIGVLLPTLAESIGGLLASGSFRSVEVLVGGEGEGLQP